jgi:hypothetical protein
MPSQVRLYISAGPDQDPARELLGRSLAEFPINVGWVIKRTPDVDSVAECHLYVLLFGPDIVAPVGLELWWARRTEKPIIGCYFDGLHTPAGQVFLQENADLNWTRCADLPALRRAVMTHLSRFVLAHAERYGVSLLEAERLRAYVASLDKTAPAPAAPKATGAGGGGVILAPGKDEPAGARLVQDEA